MGFEIEILINADAVVGIRNWRHTRSQYAN